MHLHITVVSVINDQRKSSRLEKGSCDFKVVGLNPQSCWEDLAG